METQLHGAVGFGQAAAEAVHHAAPRGAVDVAQQVEQFIVGFADMQRHWQVALGSPTQLAAQGVELLLFKGAVPVEVEPYFAYGNERDAGIEQACMHQRKFLLIVLLDRCGVQPRHAAEMLWKLAVEFVEGGCRLAVDVGQQKRVDPRIERALQRFVAVVVESLVVEVAMGVDESHGCWMISVMRS